MTDNQNPSPETNMVEMKRLRFLETLKAHLGNANAAIVFELKPSVGSKALPDEQGSSHENHTVGGENVGLLEIVISHDTSLVVVNPVVELSHAGLQAQSRLCIVETTYKGEGGTNLDLIPQVGVASPPPQTHARGSLNANDGLKRELVDQLASVVHDLEHLPVNDTPVQHFLAQHLSGCENGFFIGEVITGKLSSFVILTERVVLADMEVIAGHDRSLVFDETAVQSPGSPKYHVDVATPELAGIELAGVAEQLRAGGGVWRGCSGCHELYEGHPIGPWSETLQSYMGGGCNECGGIGAIWDTTDDKDMGNFLADTAPQDLLEKAGSLLSNEESLPTTSRLSQLEARTSCAALANYASAPPQPDQVGSSGGETRVRNAQITTAAKSPTETATAKRYEPNLDSPKEGQPDEGVGVPKQLLVHGTPVVKSNVGTRR